MASNDEILQSVIFWDTTHREKNCRAAGGAEGDGVCRSREHLLAHRDGLKLCRGRRSGLGQWDHELFALRSRRAGSAR